MYSCNICSLILSSCSPQKVPYGTLPLSSPVAMAIVAMAGAVMAPIVMAAVAMAAAVMASVVIAPIVMAPVAMAAAVMAPVAMAAVVMVPLFSLQLTKMALQQGMMPGMPVLSAQPGMMPAGIYFGA